MDKRRGMTLTEILAVIGIIIVLLAILLPGLQVVRRNGLLAKSQSNLRQVYTYVSGYSADNREFMVPSRFDYRNANYKGKVRTESPKGVFPLTGPVELSAPGGGSNNAFSSVGTWTDILWAYADMPPIVLPWGAENPDDYNYRYDSPDRYVYQSDPSFANVFRSTEMMTRVKEGSEFTPFGSGAPRSEVGHPGYFAANDYLSVVPDPDDPEAGRWFTRGQIRVPDRSVFLVDSLAGETIQENDEGWGDPDHGFETEVDFRYIGNNSLILTFEGGVKTEPEFEGIEEMEDRGYRIHDLEKRVVQHDHP
ncbi:MAG: hypothetical protein MK085_05355 [Phycisphaerales bacterium]|nr:hypothetical protein [Phycisphaerales bacterium]